MTHLVECPLCDPSSRTVWMGTTNFKLAFHVWYETEMVEVCPMCDGLGRIAPELQTAFLLFDYSTRNPPLKDILNLKSQIMGELIIDSKECPLCLGGQVLVTSPSNRYELKNSPTITRPVVIHEYKNGWVKCPLCFGHRRVRVPVAEAYDANRHFANGQPLQWDEITELRETP